MGFFRQKYGGRALWVGGALVAAITTAGLAPAGASAAGTANVQVTVGSPQANAGSVLVENIVQTTTYGSCASPSTPGSNTCTISVPSDSGVLLIAQPASGETLGGWAGKCSSAPGPVCHIQSGNANTTSLGMKLVPAGSGPAASASPEYVTGPTPNGCNAAEATTVTGTGFPANAAVILSDDGTVVASDTTDSGGNVTFPYTPAASEQGIYRTLTLTAGGQTASTDVYNSGHFCLQFSSPAPGMDQVTVNVSGLDANSSDNAFQILNRTPIVISADATGAGSASTPVFACKPGTTVTYRIYGERGVGTPSKYTYNNTGLTFTCS